MPELPEVETIVCELQASSLAGAEIKLVEVYWPRTVGIPEMEEFCRRLAKQQVVKISRRGKFIVLTLTKDSLLVHLRMTGKLTISTGRPGAESHERLRLSFKDGRILHYDDQRKFGRWYLLENPNEKFAKLGIEPLSPEFTLANFRKRLEGSSQMIKPFLLDQKHVAGLGNIYVDEALWESKIHPAAKVNALSSVQIKALHKAIRHVLEEGIAHMGTSLGNKQANYYSVSGRRGGHQTQLKAFRRDGLPCPRCGTTIAKIKLAQRGTHFCPSCQKM